MEPRGLDQVRARAEEYRRRRRRLLFRRHPGLGHRGDEDAAAARAGLSAAVLGKNPQGSRHRHHGSGPDPHSAASGRGARRRPRRSHRRRPRSALRPELGGACRRGARRRPGIFELAEAIWLVAHPPRIAAEEAGRAMNGERPRVDIIGITLAVAFIAGLVGMSLWVISPFAGAMIWAAMIVISTWNGMLWLQARLFGRRWLAVTAITVLMLLVLFVPLTLGIISVVRNADDFVGWIAGMQDFHLPPPPDWVAGVPFVGEKAAALWKDAATSGVAELAKQAKPYATAVLGWLASRAGGAGWILLQFLLTVVISAVMFAYGESAAAGLTRFGRRLAGERGEKMVLLAGRAVRGVALGIVVTAFVQSVLGGLALGLSGVPFAMALTGVMFMLCIAQLGPVLV